MRPSLFVFSVALLASAAFCFATPDSAGSALEAIKKLPRGEAKKIARIEAREGTPIPERWHILVHDPKDENGVHEYVIAGGEVVASRNVSQFAESLKPTDVMGTSGLKVDSDKVASLAQQYAAANKVTVATLNYALKKEGNDAAPLWDVTCLDEAGKELGHVVVSAGKGNVVSHDGFTAEPGAGAGLDTQSGTETDEGTRHHFWHKTVTRRPTSTPEPEKKDIFNKIGKWFSGH